MPSQGLTASAWMRVEQVQQAVIFALSDKGKGLELALEGTKLVARATMGGAPAAITQSTDLSLSQ